MCLSGAGTKARLEGCLLAGNADCGFRVMEEGEADLVDCTLRDHAAGKAAGLIVDAGSSAAVGAGCVFTRNAGGDVVRK